MITLSTEHAAERAVAALAATLNKLNSGATGAKVLLYATVRPATGDPAGGTALTTLILKKPAGIIEAGLLTLAPVDDALIMVTGAAKWARVIADNAPVFDCDVSDTDGTATLRLATTMLYAGGLVRLSSGTLG